MSRFDEYNNEFDEEDDGEELEITEEEAAASDDEGREQAALLKAHSESIAGNRKVHEDQRRMWFRMAKQALAEGAERREAAEEQERAEREQEEAAERARVKAERAAKHDRELIERADRDAAVRRQNAESARIEAEAAWRVAQVRPLVRAPVPLITAKNAASRWDATKSVPYSRLEKPSGGRDVSMRGPALPIRSAPALQSQPSASRLRETRRSGHAPQTSPSRIAPQPQRLQPEGRVAPSPSAPKATSAPRRPTSPHPATPITRPPAPMREGEPPRALALSSTPVLSGADLAAWRSARGLTQRPAAELLGVAPSTVAKAELLPGKALGEQLQIALAAALAR